MIEARGLANFVVVVTVTTRAARIAIMVFMPDDIPTRREKDTMSRRQKLLQRPSSLEPFTRPKRARIPKAIVFEVDVAFRTLSVPSVHGIDRF